MIPLGRTGFLVSRLCFGTVYLGPYGEKLSPQQGGRVLVRAWEEGVNFWDTSDDYGTHPHVAAALQRVDRGDVVVMTKTSAETVEEVEKSLHQSLEELGTDYIDILLLHYVKPEWIANTKEILESLHEGKGKGLLRAVGLSTHSVETTRQVAKSALVEVVLTIANKTGSWLCNGQPAKIEDGDMDQMWTSIKKVYQAGKGVCLMKILASGTIAPSEAIDYVTRHPHFHSLVIGMKSLEEVNMNLSLIQGGQSDRPNR